jgi:hypothetical protein
LTQTEGRYYTGEKRAKTKTKTKTKTKEKQIRYHVRYTTGMEINFPASMAEVGQGKYVGKDPDSEWQL